MPNSKLVEKLGFRVTEHGDVVNLAAKFLDAPELRELGSEKYARIALWNLCLELSERLAEHEKRWHLMQQPNRGIECATIIQAADPERKDA